MTTVLVILGALSVSSLIGVGMVWLRRRGDRAVALELERREQAEKIAELVRIAGTFDPTPFTLALARLELAATRARLDVLRFGRRMVELAAEAEKAGRSW